jgi:tRNA-specific 2-thiouridylase
MKIAVGLSGGVDSAVAAALLKQQGHEVIGVFMKNWSDDFGIEGDCPWEEDLKSAREVADHIGIEFLSYNFELEYRKRVIEYFFAEYKSGRTPNPDILCNSEIKFNVFRKKVFHELGVDKIATGHYARVVYDRGIYRLLKGIDQNKDQSYFLCRLSQEELANVEFPIGHLTKPQVRKIAAELGLPNAYRKDSQGICFVGKINVRTFLEKELGKKKGKIIDIDSQKELGEHDGIWFYTIGQRQGMGLPGGPWFVVKKDSRTDTLYVAKGKDNPALFSREVYLRDIHVINPEFDKYTCASLQAEVSLRYRQRPSNALISLCRNNLNQTKLIFFQPQRAVAPGQFGCIYMGDEAVASGIIEG